MIETAIELMKYLSERGDKYGITAEELLDAIPEEAREPEVAYAYMQEKDISHKVPLSQGGDPAGDNWVLEDSDVNQKRGAEVMTAEEIDTAEVDGNADAKRLMKTAAAGATLAGGSALFEGAVFAGEFAGGLVATEAALLSTVVVPTLVTGALVCGAAWLGWKLYKTM